jgi:uncharacterized membrane protein YhaH (DUF805 family)
MAGEWGGGAARRRVWPARSGSGALNEVFVEVQGPRLARRVVGRQSRRLSALYHPFLVLPKGYEPDVVISALFGAVLLVMSYLWIACSVRRLHDRGKHGAWFFLYFLPVVGSMWMLIECGILGSAASERYGLTPRMLREIFD